MTKKKKRQVPEVEELLARPWCYYCERDFDDLKILIHHQKAKHFKCDRCSRRLNTAGGLRVHMEQVHKETLEQVENALPGRESVDLEIFGTEGIPESEVAAHNQRILSEYARKEADKRAASGQSNGPKRPKIDIAKELDPEEIKRKLQEHKRAMQSGNATPAAAGVSPTQMNGPATMENQASPQLPSTGPAYTANSPPAGYPQSPYGAPPGQGFPPATYPPSATSPYPTAPYGQPQFQQSPPTGPAAQFGRGGPPQPAYGYQPPPQQAGFGAPPFHSPPGYGPHGGAPLPQPHQIPGLPPKPNVPGLPPRPAFAAPSAPAGFASPPPGPGFSPVGPPPGAPTGPAWNPPTGPSQGFGSAVSSPPPGVFGVGPPPPGAAPYGAPPAQHQQHQSPGHGFPSFPGAPLQPPPGYAPHPSVSPVPAAPGVRGTPPVTSRTDIAAAIPPLTASEPGSKSPSSAAKEAEGAKKDPSAKPRRETRLVYGDNNTTTSPEERRAALPRFVTFRGLENIAAAG